MSPLEIPGTPIIIPANVGKSKCLRCGRYFNTAITKADKKKHCPYCNTVQPDESGTNKENVQPETKVENQPIKQNAKKEKKKTL